MRRMNGLRRVGTCGALAVATALAATAASAQGPSPTTTAGPGRIICRSAASCVLGVGIPPSIRYQIDASALPDADRQRLVKQCTAAAAPCVATVTGTETKSGIKATAIKFHN
jgi:hypothetical protein